METPIALPHNLKRLFRIALITSLQVFVNNADAGVLIPVDSTADAKTSAATQEDPDLNKSGRVDAVDLIEIVRDRRGAQPSIDLTGDSLTDGLDQLQFSKDWYTVSASGGPERAMEIAQILQETEAQERLYNENFPTLMRPAMEAYYPEVLELIVLGMDAVAPLLAEFQKPVNFLDDIPLSIYAYVLEQIGDPSAIPVLADWLEANLFSEVFWATEFVTHTLKILDGQSGLNTETFVYNIEEKFDAIDRARDAKSLRSNLACLTCKTSGTEKNICEGTVRVTGINAQGQQETLPLSYKVAKRDYQEIIDAETDPTEKAKMQRTLQGLAEVDETVYGNSDYIPLPGSQVSLKSNCAGTVIEEIFNAIAQQNSIPLTLPQGQSQATGLRDLALKFGSQVSISDADVFTVISHETSDGDSKHVEVPISSDSTSATVLSKDNYGKTRQHTISKISPFNQFDPIAAHYGGRPWYVPGSGSITTRFYRIDPARILNIVLDRGRCPCDPNAPDAIPMNLSEPTDDETEERVITVSGSAGVTHITSAVLTLNGAPQNIAVVNGSFSVEVVLSSGDNLIGITVESADGRRGCIEKRIRSTTPKSTISVTLTWNLNSTDLDLYVTQPDGETVWYRNLSSAIGGVLDVDNTSGFGPENYFISSEGGDSVLEGAYGVRLHYYDDAFADDETPTRTVTWRVVVLLNEGTEHERREIYGGNLSTANSGNDLPGSSGADWANATTLNYTVPEP
jgi:uncharacterized protein YfaP (DUF2135 family)